MQEIRVGNCLKRNHGPLAKTSKLCPQELGSACVCPSEHVSEI